MPTAAPKTTFTWAIAQLERHTKDGMIFTAHYTVSANDGTYSSGAYGSVGFEPAEPESMVPYADLTESKVLGWVIEKLGGTDKKAEIEAALQTQIDEQRKPTKAQGQPW